LDVKEGSGRRAQRAIFNERTALWFNVH